MPLYFDTSVNLPLKITQRAIEITARKLNWKCNSLGNIYELQTKIYQSGNFPVYFKIELTNKDKQKTIVRVEITMVALFPSIAEKFQQEHMLEVQEKFINNFTIITECFIKEENFEKNKQQALIEKGLLCPTCYAELAPGTKFCPNDGTEINVKTCSRCNSTNSLLSTFCSECGAFLE